MDNLKMAPKESNMETRVQYCIYKFNKEGLAKNEQYPDQNNKLLNLH
jgi:hypothetical protein